MAILCWQKMLCTLQAVSIARELCFIDMTMVRRQLDDGQWSRIASVLEAQRAAGRRGRDDRKFIEAVLWWRRTGVPWRDLPEEFGPWKTVFNRFDRWSKAGKWSRVFQSLQTDRDDEWHSIDSTINRAHQHAAGAKGGSPMRRLDVHAAGYRRRSTWSSTHSASRSRSRSRKGSATTSCLRRNSSVESRRDACSPTRHTIRTTSAARSRKVAACP